MVEYNKIETVYARDTKGTKKLIEGEYQNKAVAFLANNVWEFTEKIDGTNTSVRWDGHKITFGGRTADTSIPSELVNKLVDMFCNDETEELFEQKFGGKEVILFGEGYGGSIQKGRGYRQDVGFILFDVMISGNYQSRNSVEDIAKCFGLEIVPIVLKGTIDEAVAFVKLKPDSTIGTAKMEGVVGRPLIELQDRCGNRIITKIKVRDFI